MEDLKYNYCEDVTYDSNTNLITFFFRNGEITSVDSRLIQGFEPYWEISELGIHFPETNTSLSFKSIYEGLYGTQSWMEVLNKLQHKGYQGVWDGYHGSLILPRDVVTFCGETLDLAYQAFLESIEDYEQALGDFHDLSTTT